MNTSESCAVVRPFSYSSALKNLEMLKTLFLIKILNYLIPAQKNLRRFLPVLKFQISVFQKIFQLITQRGPESTIAAIYIIQRSLSRLYRFSFCFYFKSWHIGKS